MQCYVPRRTIRKSPKTLEIYINRKNKNTQINMNIEFEPMQPKESGNNHSLIDGVISPRECYIPRPVAYPAELPLAGLLSARAREAAGNVDQTTS